MEDALYIGIRDDQLLIKAEGDMRAGNSFALNKFLLPYLEKTDKKLVIILDMSSCAYMDSTFIGFLVSLEKKCRLFNPDCVKIINPSEKCRRALDGLSCLDKLSIHDGAKAPAIPAFKLEGNTGSFSERENLEIVFEAHRGLSEISEENRREFQDLLDELKRVLEKK